jgi:hypothetical protein
MKFSFKKVKEVPIYVFLDIDGVLNSSRSWNTKYYIDEECVKNLREIVKDNDIRIILTSTWRAGFDKINKKHTINVQNLLNILHKYNMDIYDVTEQHISGDRSKEIERYIIKNNVNKYIILDDDVSIFSNKDLNIYLVDYRTGLTLKDIDNIRRKIKDERKTTINNSYDERHSGFEI